MGNKERRSIPYPIVTLWETDNKGNTGEKIIRKIMLKLPNKEK